MPENIETISRTVILESGVRYTVPNLPAGVSAWTVTFTLTGAGGGAGGDDIGYGGGYGGNGGLVSQSISVTPGESFTFYKGLGGAGGASGVTGSGGGAGGTNAFAIYSGALGGNAGVYGSSGAGGGGGAASILYRRSSDAADPILIAIAGGGGGGAGSGQSPAQGVNPGGYTGSTYGTPGNYNDNSQTVYDDGGGGGGGGAGYRGGNGGYFGYGDSGGFQGQAGLSYSLYGGTISEGGGAAGGVPNGNTGSEGSAILYLKYTPTPKAPLPTTGSLTLNDIQTNFGGSNPIGMNEYYKGGGLVLYTDSSTTIPASSTIGVGNFRGAGKAVLRRKVFLASETWTIPTTAAVDAGQGVGFEILVVGGGGGGLGVYNGGAGGGAGGVAYHPNFTGFSPGQSVSVQVGGGGGYGTKGSDSYFYFPAGYFYAYGGGNGGAGVGGSGGGAQSPGGGGSATRGYVDATGNNGNFSLYGNAGGYANRTPGETNEYGYGGGGGASQAGGFFGPWGGGPGGNGIQLDMVKNGYGSPDGWVAGGGGGGAGRSALTFLPQGNGTPGGYGGGGTVVAYQGSATVNTGGGGPGAAGGEGWGYRGQSGPGGSGIVIIRGYW